MAVRAQLPAGQLFSKRPWDYHRAIPYAWEGVPMEIPVRFSGSGLKRSAAAAGLMAMLGLLTACAAGPQQNQYLPLDTKPVEFPNGRVTLYLLDEMGLPMTRTKVDFSWDEPNFYRTMGFTDNLGRVTFAGVPEVASVTIDHPGGSYMRTLLVPQRGVAELRVMLDTYGANAINRERERPMPAITNSNNPAR
jgi:hypothetical protein